MAEIDNDLVLEICRLRAEEFDRFSVAEHSNRYRNSTNRGRIDAGFEPLDHYEWRSKLQKVIRLIEGKQRGNTNY